jgi:mannose-1-phosphate guanylyltransferase
VLYAVILAGGRGERFWPWSRQGRPKQLLPIAGAKTLLEETVERVLPAIPRDRVLLVTGQDLAGVISRQWPQLGDIRIIAEPMGRNTAAAIGLAAAQLHQENPEAVMAVLSADHQIQPQEGFLASLSLAAECARKENWLVTFGIPPSRAETGYGYIELGEKLHQDTGGAIHRVKEFKEKPTRAVAQQFYLDGNHLWNSGMFVWKAKTILEAMARHMPDLYAGLEEMSGAKQGARREKVIAQVYERLPSVSIDYGVMEKADNVVVLRGEFLWDDVGTWSALKRIHKPDGDGNVVIGDALAVDSFECILASEGKGLIATLGVSDLVVARVGDCVLVAHVSRTQELRKLVEKLGEREDHKDYL